MSAFDRQRQIGGLDGEEGAWKSVNGKNVGILTVTISNLLVF
jgi:hypothetical protein